MAGSVARCAARRSWCSPPPRVLLESPPLLRRAGSPVPVRGGYISCIIFIAVGLIEGEERPMPVKEKRRGRCASMRKDGTSVQTAESPKERGGRSTSVLFIRCGPYGNILIQTQRTQTWVKDENLISLSLTHSFYPSPYP